MVHEVTGWGLGREVDFVERDGPEPSTPFKSPGGFCD